MPPLWIWAFKDQLKFPLLPLWLHLLKGLQLLLLGIYYLGLLFTIQLIWSCVLSYLCAWLSCASWWTVFGGAPCFLYIMLNACRLLAGEDSWESFYCKEIKPVNPKGSQSWVFNGKTDAEAPILWHLMQRDDSLEKTLILGKIEGKRRRGWQRMRRLDSITNLVDRNLSKLRETVEDRGAWHAVVHRVAKSQTQLSDWTTITILRLCLETTMHIFVLIYTRYFFYYMYCEILPSYSSLIN